MMVLLTLLKLMQKPIKKHCLVGNVADAQYPNGRESDEIVAERNRGFRNDKLAETDWYKPSSTTMTGSAAFL